MKKIQSQDTQDTLLYKRLALRLAIAVIGVLLTIYVLPRAFEVMLPFILAWLIANLANPLVQKVNAKLSNSRRFVALLINIVIILLIVVLVYFIVFRIVQEAITLGTYLQENWSNIVDEIENFLENLTWLIDIAPPQVTDMLNDFVEKAIIALQNFGRIFITTTVTITAAMTAKTGNFFVGFITFFLALYFIIVDYDGISVMGEKFLPRSLNQMMGLLYQTISTALGGYFKAQLILSSIAMVFMFVALSLYGQPYALLMAFLLAFVDLLPILGCIAVLLPWGIIEFIGGDVHKAIFLVVIGVVFMLVRRVLEPKVMGSQTGLHPLLALISTYVGLQFSGIWGAVFGALLAMLVINIAKTGIFNNAIADIKALFQKFSDLLDSGERRYLPILKKENQS
ncbi:MAG: sporulation integral membrane protein YtvI [Eubacteriaceae bacterium]|nr:sporulation integral membrane protein YtvI [Eubacteriaceae bacterium]